MSDKQIIAYILGSGGFILLLFFLFKLVVHKLVKEDDKKQTTQDSDMKELKKFKSDQAITCEQAKSKTSQLARDVAEMRDKYENFTASIHRFGERLGEVEKKMQNHSFQMNSLDKQLDKHQYDLNGLGNKINKMLVAKATEITEATTKLDFLAKRLDRLED